MAPPKPLFDDEEDVHQQAELRVNEQFARRFEARVGRACSASPRLRCSSRA